MRRGVILVFQSLPPHRDNAEFCAASFQSPHASRLTAMRGSSLQARAERQATACPPTGNSHEILRLAHAAYAGEPVLARRDDLLSCRGAASPGNATERGHVSDSRPGRGIVGRQGCRLACRSRRQGRHKVGGPGTAPSAGCHASVLYDLSDGVLRDIGLGRGDIPAGGRRHLPARLNLRD